MTAAMAVAVALVAAPIRPSWLPDLRLDARGTFADERAFGGRVVEDAAYGITGLAGGALMGIALALAITARPSTPDATIQLAVMTGALLGAAAGGALGAVAGAGDELARRSVWQLCLLDCGVGAVAVALLLLASLGPPFGGG